VRWWCVQGVVGDLVEGGVWGRRYGVVASVRL
jgi:hypothetical protein